MVHRRSLLVAGLPIYRFTSLCGCCGCDYCSHLSKSHDPMIYNICENASLQTLQMLNSCRHLPKSEDPMIQVSTNINKNTHPYKPYSQSVSQLFNSCRHLSKSYDPMVQVSTNFFGKLPGTLCIGASFS